MLSEEDKRRIEEEEAYRAKVRAAAQPPKKESSGCLRTVLGTLGFLILIIVLIVFFARDSAVSQDKPAAAEKFASRLPSGLIDSKVIPEGDANDFAAIVAMFGPPERDDSTAYDRPRPLLVTRFVEYRPEKVKIIFVPKGKAGDPPPYKGWTVVGYIDLASNTKISAGEAEARLQGRRKNRH